MPLILDGKYLRDKIADDLEKKLKNVSVAPTLVILQVGERPDSEAYIRQKKIFAERIGVKIIHTVFPVTVEEKEILTEISRLNSDPEVHGILLQIPLPPHLNAQKFIENIDQIKDVDGLSSKNTECLWQGNVDGHMPATARGILSLLEYFRIRLESKHVTVVGKSTLVGKPIALALLNKGATVTVCHKLTKDLSVHTKAAEILIVAIGDPEFITAGYVAAGQTIIDVGINSIDQNGSIKIVGDVKSDDVEKIVSALTPVPGGVGPMTVASLFLNLYDAYIQLTTTLQ